MNDPLRHRPPERTLRWVTESVDAGSRSSSLRRLSGADGTQTTRSRSSTGAARMDSRGSRLHGGARGYRARAALRLARPGPSSPGRGPGWRGLRRPDAADHTPSGASSRPSSKHGLLPRAARAGAVGHPRRERVRTRADPLLPELSRPPFRYPAAVVTAPEALGAGARA